VVFHFVFATRNIVTLLELGKIRGGIRRLTDTSTLPAYGSGNQLKVGETAEVLLVECGQHRSFGFLGESDKVGVDGTLVPAPSSPRPSGS
jgi:hypothetical protein